MFCIAAYFIDSLLAQVLLICDKNISFQIRSKNDTTEQVYEQKHYPKNINPLLPNRNQMYHLP